MGLAHLNLGMAEVEKQGPDKFDASALKETIPNLRTASELLQSSLNTVKSVRDVSPSQLQQEIAVTSFYVEKLIWSLEAMAKDLEGGAYPAASLCAESTLALREIYSVMTRNALAKR